MGGCCQKVADSFQLSAISQRLKSKSLNNYY